MRVQFTVLGLPRTKGSARAYVPDKWAKAAAAIGKAPRAVVRNDNPNAKDWQDAISRAVVDAMARSNVQAFPCGPVVLEVWFYFPRPKNLLTKKWANVDVPHTKKPDLDKTLRCVKDALSKVLYGDDSQVTDVAAHKRYCEPGQVPRAEITVQSAKETQIPRGEASRMPTLFGEGVYGEG
jgi:Holliday junction resolvase RusA-like endonuclease